MMDRQERGGVRPKKALGQHFLHDLSVASRIADILPTGSELPLLEVGPGMGVLTQYLLPKYPELYVVELDSESVEYLREHMPELEDRIIEGDFLELDLEKLFSGQPFMLIGNFPYNISSQIFFKMLDYRHLIPAAGGMLQREVAQRLASPAGNKSYGILSVLLQTWYDISYLFTVGEGAFNPPPKVKSGVIRLERNQRVTLGCDEQLYKRVIKTTFNQRRKTIRNSLRSIVDRESLPNEAEGLLSKRPEQLSVEDFITLTNYVASALNRGEEK
ncbi:MAG: 16S rRNA (adenine(1518)-N(6)/adenine(1519)-N(6))-dimethyltransferase RsmA [Porphyromonas sp.]|nr:16S rRNA (adenine(1518)-N(6)/adenine(1519)-N(6))-dimethyltransferase RsmA [Porphyromonas sp.]